LFMSGNNKALLEGRAGPELREADATRKEGTAQARRGEVPATVVLKLDLRRWRLNKGRRMACMRQMHDHLGANNSAAWNAKVGRPAG
jgi:hypothetical protein